MIHPGPIGLGDLFRAAELFDADAATTQRLASLLGVAGQAEQPVASPVPPPPGDEGKTVEGQKSDLKKPPQEEARTPSTEHPPSRPLLISSVRPGKAATRKAPPSWLDHPLPMPDLGSTTATPRPPDLTFVPLLKPQWQRAILSTALGVTRADGPVDVPALVERVAGARFIGGRWPRLPRRTLSRGVQVLRDVSEGMTPFARDASELVEAVRRLFRFNNSVLRFSRIPTRAGLGPASRWKEYQPPDDGRPVLVLSDLGLSSQALVDFTQPRFSWSAFVERVHKAGSPVVLLVPYAAQRWPAELERLPLVEWDFHTTARSVQRTLRRHTSRGAP